MQPEDLIPAETFCAVHSIELSFIRSLHDSGLVGMIIREGAFFLPSSELPQLEKLVRMHYELDINIAGIEAVTHLLGRLQDLEQQVVSLQNRVRFYQAAPPSFRE